MKANELRIGNYVKTYNDFVIKSYSAEGLYNIMKRIDEYKPIPLTEEWLLKFGFKKSFTLVRQDSCYRIDIFRIDLFGEYFYLWHDNHPIISIEYVHQLQNLYFALTNEELTYEQQK